MTALLPLRPTLPVDDRGLVLAHRDGVEGAFDELFRRYRSRLVTFLARRTGDAAAAEDLAQETLIRALSNLDRFDPDRPLWPWLRRIATNVAIDWSRARTRSTALESALAAQPVPAGAPDPGEDLGENQVMAAALSRVPERQRAALELCYVEGWRPVDVAPQFGVGSNAFEQLLHRARGNLRKAYTAQAPERTGALALVLAPWHAALDRIRQVLSVSLDGRTRHVAEAAVAVLVVGAAVGIPLQRGTAPQATAPDAPPPAAVAPAGEGATQASGIPSDVVRDAMRGTADGVQQPEGPAVLERAGAGVASPVARTPQQAQPQELPVPGSGSALPGEAQPRSGSSAPAPGAVQDVPEVDEGVGGCGSTVRAVMCTAVEQLDR